MNKRSFLKLCAALATNQLLPPLFARASMEKLKNWAGNFEYGTENLYSAKSLEQVQQFIKKQTRLKVLGTRHCFNKIADSTHQFISLKEMDQIVALGHNGPHRNRRCRHDLRSLVPPARQQRMGAS